MTETQGTALQESLLDATLEQIAIEGWRGLTMGALARHANVPLADLYRRQGSKTDLLTAFLARIDLAALSEDPQGAMDAETSRDRLFDSVLLRFEAMEPYRDAVQVLREELPRDPMALAAVLPAARRSLAWTLDAAGLDPNGLSGAVRVRVLGFICLRTLDVWLTDDGADLAKTMADLDRRLRRASRWLGLDERRGSGGRARDEFHDDNRGHESADAEPDAARA